MTNKKELEKILEEFESNFPTKEQVFVLTDAQGWDFTRYFKENFKDTLKRFALSVITEAVEEAKEEMTLPPPKALHEPECLECKESKSYNAGVEDSCSQVLSKVKEILL